MTANSLTCNVSYTLDGGVDDVVESCVYLSTIIIYDFRTYAPTPLKVVFEAGEQFKDLHRETNKYFES